MYKIIKRVVEKLIEKPVSDPVKIIPRKAMEQIFGYLNARDILQCTLVNKDWNKAIGKSLIAMEKIKICVCEPFHGIFKKFTASDAVAIVKGGRRYKHISLFITRRLTADHILLIASFKWKSLLLCHHTFKSEIELINFIGIIEPHIETLDFRTIRIASSKKDQIALTNFAFPKLKKLRLANCYTFVYSDIFKNIEKLDTLEIETGPPPSHAYDNRDAVFLRVAALQSILVKNFMVRHLNLYLHQMDFECMFSDSRLAASVRFQLDSLRISKFRKLVEENCNEVQLKNFGFFLSTQQKALRSIHIYDWLGNGILELIINTMDRLKILVIGDLECYGKFFDTIANMDLYMNESVETIRIVEKYSKVNDLQKLLLECFPGLKNLEIGTINQAVLKILIERTPKIENITVDLFTPYIIPDENVLTNLKKMTITSGYAPHFRDMLRDYNNYTNFENVFLKAARDFDHRNKR